MLQVQGQILVVPRLRSPLDEVTAVDVGIGRLDLPAADDADGAGEVPIQQLADDQQESVALVGNGAI